MLRRINPTMWAVWLMTVCGVPAATVVALHTTMDAFFAPLLPRIDAGVISYAWMLLATYLSTRPHWLDRLIGLPSIYMMHSVLGVAALAVAVLHRIDLPAYGPAKWAGEVAFWMLLALVVVALVTLSGWLSGRFVAAAKLRRSVERVVPREGSVRLHRLLPVAVVAVAVHEPCLVHCAERRFRFVDERLHRRGARVVCVVEAAGAVRCRAWFGAVGCVVGRWRMANRSERSLDGGRLA